MGDKPFIKAAKGQKTETMPVWFMRQAGRYLPEYMAIRAKAGSFLKLCYNPEWAVEVTMQPIRRFGFDAAILFSDILVIPQALGQSLDFVAGEGPKLDPIRDKGGLGILYPDKIDETLSPIYETVSGVRGALDDQTALIGFAGAPWTVVCYMVEGGGSKDFHHVKNFAYSDPKGFQRLIDIVTDATIHYLKRQIAAGAEAIQIFDSWAGILPPGDFERWSIQPTCRIVKALRDDYPDIPIIGFPRCAGLNALSYAAQTGIDVMGLDTTVPISKMQHHLPKVVLQGNLDPVYLLQGGTAMEDEIRRIKLDIGGKPHIFNLGHGVIKETPPDHVQQAIDIIREA